MGVIKGVRGDIYMAICYSACDLFYRVASFWNWLTQGHVLLSFLIILIVLWYIDYRFFKSDRLALRFMPGELNKFVVSNTPELSKVYRPTPYLLNGNLQTVCYAIIRKILNFRFGVDYKRDLVKLEDGGQLALDWAVFPEIDKGITESTPIVAIFAGLTGGRKDLYVATIMKDAAKRGIKSVLVNQRGCSFTPMLVFNPLKDRRQSIIAEQVRMMRTSRSWRLNDNIPKTPSTLSECH
eukprot:TRINITY_DN1620_c0_g1_i11.p1 TRINITY_DN1620_c0_g1~~TRINITY_DN1620_c0_g1_i11.p1  ORF type:complete len:265 (-),score=37.73 TRINITY_DN1620_c0_g1_i11:821-1534(-)